MKQTHVVQDACVDVEYLVQGMISNNVYIVSDGKGVIVVDPSCKADEIIEALGSRKLDAIFLTHHHWDHMGAAFDLREKTGAVVIASAIEAPKIENQDLIGRDMKKTKACPVDQKVSQGDVVKIGDMAWRVIETPGHTKGGICFFILPEFGSHPEGRPVLLSGDTLFCGTIGRTDFEGGSLDDMRRSLKKLAALPDDALVLPGHDRLTCIKDERLRVFAQYA